MTARPGLNQEIIINKAMEIADQKGIEAVTMATLAKELAVKSPSLYNHIEGLKEVKQMMAVKALDLLYQHIKKATLNKAVGAETIRAFGYAYIEFAQQNPGIYQASLSAPYPFAQNFQNAGETVMGLTREILSVYHLNEIELIHTVRGLRSVLHGLIDLKSKNEFNLDVNLEESQGFVLNIFIKGLR